MSKATDKNENENENEPETRTDTEVATDAARVRDDARKPPAEGSLVGEVARAVVALGCLGSVVSILGYGLSLPGVIRVSPPLVDVKTTKGTVREICGPPSRDGRPVVIEMLYSDDKQTWIEESANRFARICPNIQVKLTAMGDIESADAILSGEITPTLWSPADDLVVRYLEHRKLQTTRASSIHLGAPTSIARSPLVVLAWREQERVLESIFRARPTTEGPWVDVACAHVPRDPDLSKIALEDMTPGRWIDWYNASIPPPPKRVGRPAQKQGSPDYKPPFPTLEEIREWGRVKFVHASPTRSASGLEALYMMAYDYALPPGERPGTAPEDVAPAAPSGASGLQAIQGSDHLREAFQRAFSERKDALRRWLRRCEAGLDVTPRSAKLLTDTMFHVGPSRYHFVATYEQLIFSVMDKIDENASVMDNLRVLYPRPTIINQHPVISLLPGGSEHDRERAVAQHWIQYLLSPQIQRRAIELGFRPAIPEVAIRDHRASANPFLRLRRYGVEFERPLLEPPRLDGEVIQELIELWEDATGRN